MTATSRPASAPAQTRDTADTFRLAHVSDTHVALTQYPVTSQTTARNQREQDFLRAFVQAFDDINTYDPPLVIHSGDVTDRAIITYRQQRQVQEAFTRLTRRPDGTPRLVVVISGNHDMPRDPREPCHLEPALRPLPSVVCITNKYVQVDCDDLIASGQAPAELAGVVVHCLPHDQLKRDDWDDITPVIGKVNILTSHGVVGGSELYKRSLGREYAIPIDVLLRSWDYVALGHWHKPGPVAVGGLSEQTTPIYYAGSTENCGFSDLRDGVDGRGYNQVTVRPGQVPLVHRAVLPIRAMFRLPVLDADGLDFEQITARLIETAREADLAGAIVDQSVINIHRDTWSLVDVAAAKKAAAGAMWYQATPKFTSGTSTGEETGAEKSERLGDLGAVLAEQAKEMFTDTAERDRVLGLARKYLGSALAEGPELDEDSTSTPGTSAANAPAAAPVVAAVPEPALTTNAAADGTLEQDASAA